MKTQFPSTPACPRIRRVLQRLARHHSAGAAVAIATFLVLLTGPPGALADTRAIEFKNNTGKAVDDLHIETTFGSALAMSQPFPNDLQPDTRTHNLWGATVPNGGSAVVRLNTAPGDRATITRWWWTLGGNALSNGVAVGSTNGDNGGLRLSSTNGPATGDGEFRVSLGDHAYHFFTVAGDAPQETLARFAQFLDLYFQNGETDLIESYFDATEALVFLGNIQGDPQFELRVQVVRPDSTQALLFRPFAAAIPGQAPSILHAPQDQSACAGGSVTFSVGAQGAPPVSFQWEWNGVEIPEATAPVLMLPSVLPHNAGAYRARVSNPFGSTYSPAALLTVLQPPVILAPPQNVTAPAGTDAVLNVAAGGATPLFYQWRRQGIALANGGRMSGADSPALRIAAIQAGDIGAYDVVIANACGTLTTPSAMLIVQTNPGTGSDRTFVAANPLSIPSSGPAAPYPSTLSVSGLAGTVRKITVTLSNLQHSFPGDIDVLLVGPQGQKAILISDVGGPSAMDGVTLTLDHEAPAGMPATGFILTGTYRPTDYNVDDPDVFTAPAPAGPYNTSLGAFNGTDPNGTWRLFVLDDTVDDSGQLGNGWSLRVMTTGETGTPPSITAQPQTRTVACHEDGVMVVGATGSAPLSYQWSLNGAPIPGATLPSLAMSPVTAAKVGVYVAVITNAYGAVTSAPALLTALEAPPRLTLSRSAANLVLTWPETCQEYILQQAERLMEPWPPQSPTVWQRLENSPELVGGQHRVTLPLAEAAAFFRLVADEEPSGSLFNPYGRVSDAFHQINSVMVDSEGMSSGFERLELPADAFTQEPFADEPKTDGIEPTPGSKISPGLARLLETLPSETQVELIVTFQEDLRLPWLPELTTPAERDLPSNPLATAVNDIRRIRHGAQASRIAELRRQARFTLGEQFWLANAIEITTTLADVAALSRAPGVVYLQPVDGGEEPPDANPLNDIDDGRRLILSDAYYGVGLTNPWIGLLDTGVRSTHILFNNPSYLDWLRDCVNGGPNCAGSRNPGYDTSDVRNHGTGSAAILSGNNRLGNAYRGATAIRLDSWKVYPDGKGLNTKAVLRGLQSAVAASDKVIVCELQADESEVGAIATAADNAYNTGAIVVAPAGDFGPAAFTMRSPAIAHKVLGVGAYQVDTQAQYAGQSRGPARDGRYKPDLQAPTGTETASATGDAALRIYNGTSGAAPYAGAAAMLSRNWLQRWGTLDHGQSYSWMMLSGQRAWPYNNTVGAGPIRMPVNGWAYWGKLNVRHRRTINIPIRVAAGRNTFEAALWWPESAAQAHNDIDIHLIDPNGVVRASGPSFVSVFERVTVAGPLTPGLWRVRIRGYNVPTRSQVVYWSAVVHF